MVVYNAECNENTGSAAEAKSAQDELFRKDLITAFETGRPSLTELEVIILQFRFGFFDEREHTPEEIASHVGMSPEDVRNLLIKVMRKLHHPERIEFQNLPDREKA